MKKKTFTISGIMILSIALLLVAALFFQNTLYENMFLPKGSFTVDEKTSDNPLNDNRLLLMNDKLYYNYNAHSSDKYGTYEIDENGSRRVQYDGYIIKETGPRYNFKVFRNNLILTEVNKTGTLYRYNPDTQSVEKFSVLKDFMKNHIQSFDIIDGKIYLFSKDKIYMSSNGENTEGIFKLNNVWKNNYDEKQYCISGDFIAYISTDGYVKKYNYKTRKNVFSEKLKESKENLDNDCIMMCGDNILLKYYSDVNFNCIVYNATDNFKKIYSVRVWHGYDYGYIFNAYNDTLFVSVREDGVYSVDIKTGRTKKLTSGDTKDIYVFGDKWIYCVVGEEENLWRVSQDGKTTEKIFN